MFFYEKSGHFSYFFLLTYETRARKKKRKKKFCVKPRSCLISLRYVAPKKCFSYLCDTQWRINKYSTRIRRPIFTRFTENSSFIFRICKENFARPATYIFNLEMFVKVPAMISFLPKARLFFPQTRGTSWRIFCQLATRVQCVFALKKIKLPSCLVIFAQSTFHAAQLFRLRYNRTK